MKGYWFECLMDLTLRPKTLAGNLCGDDVDLGFNGDSYVGQLHSTSRTGATTEPLTVHIPRLMGSRPPSELVFALVLGLTTHGAF
jgi:hypothetical protein